MKPTCLTQNLREIKWSLIVGLLLVAFGCVGSSDKESLEIRRDELTQLEKICNGTSGPLNSISQVRGLIKQLKSQSPIIESCKKFVDSFKKLLPILNATRSGKICNLSLIRKIRNYHNKFIYTKDEKTKNPNVPKALHRFFVSLCFQIDAECKMSFINNLEIDTKERITEEDYYSISVLENYGATLLGSEEPIADFDDIILVKDLKSEEEGVGLNLALKTRTTELMMKLVMTCKQKFKPFYDKLIMPLIELSNLGYDYQGELLARELIELRQNKLAIRWYNIVQACETFGAFTIYEDPKVKLVGDSQIITFVDKVEEMKLKEQKIKTLSELANSEIAAASENSMESIKYDPIASHNMDTLWIVEQEELDDLIKKVKLDASEDSRVRRRLMKKILKKIVQAIKTGKVLIFAKDILFGTIKRDRDETPVQDVNQEMIKLFDAAVTEIENLDSSARSVSRGPGYYKGSHMPRKPISRGHIPPKIDYIPNPIDASSLSSKFDEGIMNRFRPTKKTIFFTLLGIIGILLIFVAVALHSG